MFSPGPGIVCSLKKIELTFTEPLIARPCAKLFTCISFNPQNRPIRLVLLFSLRVRTDEKSISRTFTFAQLVGRDAGILTLTNIF